MNRKGIHLAAVGLLFLFGACEKDISEGFGDDKKVEILLSTNITNYHTGADMVRSSAASEPISTMIPLNNDFHLRATLIPDSEELRINEAFMDEQKLCFAAYKLDGTQVGSTAVYSYSVDESKWEPVGEPLRVVPDDVTEYRFVAYSYFESKATPSVTGIDPSYDLVWGMSTNTKIEGNSEAERTVSIHMTHKFARVKVRVRSTQISTATITALSGVEVGDGKLASLDPFTGDIMLGNAAIQDVDITVPNPAEDDIESLYRTVTPVGTGTVSLKLGTLEVSTASSMTFSNKWAAFNGTLDEATSYTLVVDLKRGIGFAFSNIYWDGEKLTFDMADKGHQGYQGLYFRWGSLVGISPVGDWVNGSTPVYRAGDSAPSTYPSWNGLDGISYDTGSSVLGAPNISILLGDICKYIHSGYRMPVKGDFGTSSNWDQQGWEIYGSTAFSSVTTDKTDGTYDFIANGASCAKNTAMGGVIFPASGYRNSSDGKLGSVGSTGYHWSSSPESVSNSFRLGFNSSGVTVVASAHDYGFSVRCVQN
jgi:hypothetical protein